MTFRIAAILCLFGFVACGVEVNEYGLFGKNSGVLGAHGPSGISSKASYFASKSLQAGDDGRTAVVLLQSSGDGRELLSEIQSFVSAVERRPDATVPYLVATRFSQWKAWSLGGDAFGAETSSFDVLDRVVTLLNDRNRFPNLTRIVVTGRGLGGQCAWLYAAVGRGRDSNGVELEFAPLSPTASPSLDDKLVWPFGLKYLPRYAQKPTYVSIEDNLLGRRIWRGAGGKAETMPGFDDPACLDFVLDGLPRRTSPWRVTVAGRELPLHVSRALRGVFSFASFEVKGDEEVVVFSPEGKVERFVAERPFRRVFKPHGPCNALALFGDAPDASVPDRNDPKVKWFGPGEHHAGAIRLKDGETLYLAPGSVVHGALYAKGRDITVTGRGILTGVDYPRCRGPFFFFTTFQSCTNLVIRGVTLTEPYHWTLALFDCENVLVENLRICAGNMLNDDAIDPANCRNVTMRGVFARAQDDIIALKGMQACPRAQRTPCEDFLIEDCTFWTDMANVFRIGYECNASYFANFTARNIDVVGYAVRKKPWNNEWPNVVFFLQPSNGMTIRDFRFEDVRVHSDGTDNLLVLAEPRVCGCFFPDGMGNPYDTTSYLDKYKTGGSVDGVVFRNISVEGEKGAYRGEIVVRGHSATETVRNVRFENVTRFGEKVTEVSPDLLVESAENVVFGEPAQKEGR